MQRKHKKINTCKICGQDIFNKLKNSLFCKKCFDSRKAIYQKKYSDNVRIAKLRKKFKNLDELIENFKRF
jgi:hypothetical protein